MKLRVDPWDPEYGGSIELDPDLGPPAGLDLGVEVDGAWSPVPAPASRPGVCCAFIDGVRRIDLRLFAEEGDAAAPAPRRLVGGRLCVVVASAARSPTFGSAVSSWLVEVCPPTPLDVAIGGGSVRFEPRSVTGVTPLEPIQGLQNAMREAEATLAQDILSSGSAELVISDGPLTYFASGPAIGLVKRQSRAYLDGEHAQVLGRLRVGERTPIFKFGEQRLERYSWYLCLAPRRAIDGAMAGLVRLEVLTTDGIDHARRAGRTDGSRCCRGSPRSRVATRARRRTCTRSARLRVGCATAWATLP